MREVMVGKIRSSVIFLLLLCTLLFVSVPAMAEEEPSFRLSMPNLNLQEGVSSTMVISLINAQGAQIASVDGLENFNILSQSQSTSTNIVNNVATYQLDLHVTMIPIATGEVTLKANIRYNDRDYETNELQVNIGAQSGSGNEEAPALFVRTVISHEEAYLGEKIVVTYELYTREPVQNFGLIDYGAIDDAISKEIPNDQLKEEVVYVDGYQYTLYEVKQIIIDPMRTGIYAIPSFRLQANVIDRSNRGGFFGGFMQTITPRYLQTEEKEILVKALPLEGRPDHFSGIIGELNIESNYSRLELNYGESLAVQVELFGYCNFDGMKNLIQGAIPNFTLYETLKSTEESVENNRYHAKRTFELILIPEKTGMLNIPATEISYFNPVNSQYETVEIPEATIHVLGEMPIYGGGEVEVIRISQVMDVNLSDSSHYFTVRIQKSWLYVISIGIFVIALIMGGFFWLKSNRKKQDPVWQALYREAMQSTDTNKIYNLLNDMMKHCYQVNLKTSPKSAIQRDLPDATLSKQIIDTMDCMESAVIDDEKKIANLKNQIKGVYLYEKNRNKNAVSSGVSVTSGTNRIGR